MDIILQGPEHVAAIQDYILITGKDDEQHIQNLNTVLSSLDSYGLRLQLNKCKFMQWSVTCMGCVISAEGISPTEDKAAARLQRWSLLLSSYHYEIEFKLSAEVVSSDALARLPLQYRKDASIEGKISQVSAVQLRKHFVSVLEIARQAARNPVLAKAPTMTQYGWPAFFCTIPELKPFFLRKDELSVEQGCLLWGLRTVIPQSLQEQIRSELHKAHAGVARMKEAARSHVWWPGIDSDIEERARGCKQCFQTRKAPQAASLSPWSWPTAPWQRVRVDFATHQSNHYLIVADAHSKWPEVIGPMKTTTATVFFSSSLKKEESLRMPHGL
ncbi:uncharacterized protein K02A2.6-like [Stylophora pistillata]|uniref:uncharacterized protein K02A2.6-like n=1 Tax=Stylophora pistillata TaxID=50429 RepID=UPI000C043820|nr:uncharacterized protein K02A2.6-like [Stylophora pistillata]